MGRPLPDGLAAALESARVAPLVAAAARERFGPAARVARVAAEVLHRRVVRYAVELEGSGGAERLPARWSLIGKVYESPAAGEAGFRALCWMREQGFAECEPRAIALPRPLAAGSEPPLVLMEEVGGEALKGLLKRGAARPEHLGLFAEALVKLHSFPAVFGAPFTLDDHLARRCAGLVGPLARDFPELAPAIARIVAAAREAAAPAGELVLAHGDFHAGQVHLEAGRLWLVDLDPLHHGDPAYDLAMVLVGLQRLEPRLGGARARELQRAFFTPYFGRLGLASAARVPLNAALIYLKRACKRYRWQDEPGWQEDVRRQVRRGEACLAWQEPLRAARDVDALLAASVA